MGHHTEAFVGIDTSKLRNAVAIADSGRGGEVRYLGEFPATEAAIQKLVAKLAAKYRHLTFCYEAGPTGYGLYRLLKSLSHECLVVAPSLVPKKAGDRVKTNRRDAVSLAKLLRAGELTAVWVPDERHEAMRDLSRARQAVKKDLQGKRQQISSLMLRLGRIYPGKTTWGPAHMRWLISQKLEHREQRIAFEELLEGIRQESERMERLEDAIREVVPEWSLAEVVAALQAMRGIDLIAAVGVLAEIGDLSRFQNPRELMGYPYPQKIRLATRSSEAASPKPVMGGHDVFLWRRPGAIDIRHASAETSSQRWRPHRDARARLRGKRKPDCAGASAHSSGRASGEL